MGVAHGDGYLAGVRLGGGGSLLNRVGEAPGLVAAKLLGVLVVVCLALGGELGLRAHVDRGLGRGEVDAHRADLVTAHGREAGEQVAVELAATGDDVDGLARQHAHGNVDDAAALGDKDALALEGAVRLDDVGRLAGDGVARDRDLATIDGRDQDVLVGVGKDGAQQRDKQPQQGDCREDLDRDEVPVKRHEGGGTLLEGADPRHAQHEKGDDARERRDDPEYARESLHGSLPDSDVH